MSLATPDMIRRLQEALGTKAKQEPTYRFYLLYDKVHRADILAQAYALAKQRDGAPGVDGETFEAIEAVGRERWLGWPRHVDDASCLRTRRPIVPSMRRPRDDAPGLDFDGPDPIPVD